MDSLLGLTRTAWVPVTCDLEVAPLGSKFGGSGYLPPGERWPRCSGCDRHMLLFVQLAMATLPPEHPLVGEGLFQLFGCVAEEYEAPLDDVCVHSNRLNGAVARFVDGPLEPPADTPERVFHESAIESWLAVPDLPSVDDAENAGVSFTDVEMDTYTSIDKIPFPLACDKLGGWPRWVQQRHHEPCPECGEEMTFVMQLSGSNDVEPHYGEQGYLFQCGKHPARFFYEEVP